MFDYLLKAGIYTPSPFFFFPHKFFINETLAVPYQTSYSHFRRDHKISANLILHLFALGIQVSANFGLLHFIDKKLGFQTPVVTISSGLSWLFILLKSPSPSLVKILSSLSIFGAYSLGDTLLQAPYFEMFRQFLMLLEGAVIGHYLLKLKKVKHVLAAFAIAALYNGVTFGMSMLKKYISPTALFCINALCLIHQVKGSEDPTNPKSSISVYKFPLFGIPLAALTDQKWMILYSAGFIGSTLQGMSHDITGERATLVQLEEQGNALPQEMAHATFFPNLLFHSCLDSILAKED